MRFKDHFSQHAANYAAARPHYPSELFEFLAQQCSQRQLAWDCATGNGQAAVALAAYFDRVIATDASQAQLDEATAHAKVEYRRLAAEDEITLPANSVDLVTVAQALHWFDIECFFRNVEIVLKPGGILAVWSYGLTSVSAEVDRIVYQLYEEILGDYWPQERRLVEAAYAEVSLPFISVAAPTLQMRSIWTLQQLRDYLRSWSATQRYINQQQTNPLDLVNAELVSAWGKETMQAVCWPMTIKVSRKP